MRYHEALAWIYGFTDLERDTNRRGHPAYEDGPDRTRDLLAALGHPHHGQNFVHIGGSKGKGSVSAMISAAAVSAGLRTGTYTQPHLHSFRERFMIDGKPICSNSFARLCAQIKPAVESTPISQRRRGNHSTFEIASVLAFLWFAEQNVDLAVIEVGLGGRLDATQVIDPTVVALTTIVLEHTHLLGPTLAAIAKEKTGIVKPGVPVICAEQSSDAMAVIEAACVSKQAPLLVAEPLSWKGETAWHSGRPSMIADAPDDADPLAIGLIGPHQRQNAAVAWHACRALRNHGLPIDRAAIRAGFAAVNWAGRLEVVGNNPLVVVDGAHTPEAMRAAIEGIKESFGVRYGPVIFGTLRDKRISKLLEALDTYATRLILLGPMHPRAARPLTAMHKYGLSNAEVATSPTAAIDRAKTFTKDGEAIFATGSLAIAADVRAAVSVPHETDPIAR